MQNKKVAVVGAYGHTGKFVVAELRRRGLSAILIGRDATKLAGVAALYPDSEARVATINDAASLDRAVAGASAIINCAGPFADTAGPVVEAAIRSRIPYLDVSAEQSAVLSIFEKYATAARDASLAVIPAMAFYGGLADLLATAAMGDWATADEILIAVALDSWKPTRGTRLTGERNHGPRLIFSDGKLERGELAKPRIWHFPPPFGEQTIEGLSLSEAVTISRHLRISNIRAYLNASSFAELRDSSTPPPTAADESGRSSQLFLMEVVVRKADAERRTTVQGRDIYASTAPMVVEAAERVINGQVKQTGVLTPGEAFDARSFLHSLEPDIVRRESKYHARSRQ